MTELEQLREQVRTQEMDILRLRADNGNLAARVANLQRIYDNAQRHIGRLQAQIKRTPKDAAEAVFKGRTDGQA